MLMQNLALFLAENAFL